MSAVRTPKISYHRHLRAVMARNGMFATSDLVPLLAERGVVLSREQVYRLVAKGPERLNLTTLAALCDIFQCGPEELIEPVRVQPTSKDTTASPRSVSRHIVLRRARVVVGSSGDPSRQNWTADHELVARRDARPSCGDAKTDPCTCSGAQRATSGRATCGRAPRGRAAGQRFSASRADLRALRAHRQAAHGIGRGRRMPMVPPTPDSGCSRPLRGHQARRRP